MKRANKPPIAGRDRSVSPGKLKLEKKKLKGLADGSAPYNKVNQTIDIGSDMNLNLNSTFNSAITQCYGYAAGSERASPPYGGGTPIQSAGLTPSNEHLRKMQT